MAVDFFYPAYEVVRNQDRCITCRVCERQCANKVHQYDAELGLMISDESACVNCQRCVSLCPTRALKIVKTDNTFKDNVNYTAQAMTEIYRQAQSGGVLLSAMGNPAPLPVYWDKLLINASQVTNPSIDPLREPMETRVYLGSRPEGIRRDKDGKLIDDTPPQLKLEVPIMFSAMSVSYTHLTLPTIRLMSPSRARRRSSERITTPAKAACIRTSTSTANTRLCRSRRGASASITIT